MKNNKPINMEELKMVNGGAIAGRPVLRFVF